MTANEESLNPYESPEAADAAIQVEHKNLWRAPASSDGLTGTASIYRLAAAIVDEAIAILMFFVVAMSLATVGDFSGISLVVGASVWLGYFFLTEWLLHATPGKLVTGLRVCHSTGKRCTARQIAIRTATRVLEVNPLFCGLLPAGIVVNCTAHHQRIGDLLAGTLVVRKSQMRDL